MVKKILLLSALSVLLNAEAMVGTDVKEVSVSGDMKDIAGKLLPTNEIEVLENKGGVVKFALTGYVNKAASNVIYFTSKAKIISLSFAKAKTPKYETLGTENGLDKVKVIAYTTDKNLTNDLKRLFAKADKLYTENCGLCHPLHPSTEFVAASWPQRFDGMITRTSIAKEDAWAIKQWLQKHSSDFNLNK